ncbi:MAG: tRNA uridine-5-carboxymethylaminomethyl(34) synthesis GTPase MnmE [Flavobacteriales bacterium]|nr:tRNA uridine-5-carboxymethylaminomethyl(34) synthesis GTPase MnmE [Flavobacteriales bacterium]
MISENTICAIATGSVTSAIAIIRVSGNEAIQIANSIFSKDLKNTKSHTLIYGNILDGKNIIDEVLLSIFKNTKSFTGEESVEISCHGSIYIQNKIMQLLIKNGCRTATEGEFTMRAFKNGKMDLSQAESVADLIASDSEIAHKTAIKQLRGGFSSNLNFLRNKLIEFASLIELELDFSEEDVEFANRKDFEKLLEIIKKELEKLIQSFKVGNAIQKGIPVAILGAPNVGKSTLLNCLLNDKKAIVSNIAGTTRDAIEDDLNIEGIKFRFIDTAGIRDTKDEIENLGIKKTMEKAESSHIILYLIDVNSNIKSQLEELKKVKETINEQLFIVVNKIDLKKDTSFNLENAIQISAKKNIGITELKSKLLNVVNSKNLSSNDTIITNLRHYQELKLTLNEINVIINGISSGITGDFLSINIRQALSHLGSITGEVTTDTLLGNIFGKFCIGK